MMANLPKWYIDWIPRVSDIVSFIFPFKGEDKRRYKEWLYGKWINDKIYLKEAQDVWTFVHQQLENYLNWEEQETKHKLYSLHKKEIDNWIKFIKDIKKKYKKKDWWKYVAEPVLLDEYWRYQGSSDLVLINNKKKEVVVIDWKTFWIAKKRWNLPNKYKKPYDKIKKGKLQFSLYGYTFIQQWYKVNELILVYLRDDDYYAYQLEQEDISSLDNILTLYKQHLLNKNIIMTTNIWTIKAPLKIHLQTAPKPYQNISVDLDLSQLDNGQTAEEAINEAVRVQKLLHNTYINEKQ